ncbi:hypothetical protein CJ026_026365 [Ralstonia pickettii]|uniref:NAD(P)-dependent oxidoreductase n=1 Tax=Ralstonia pickettii TaxID=329 RepID=UPI000CD58BCB|nr:hypothetical protein CJ026_026365 [Ralstonia pickettii]
MSVRVIVTRQIHATALDRLVGAGLDVVRPDPGADLSVLAAEADVLVTQLTDVVDERVLAAGNRLRLVANVAAGYDNIDLDAARRFGVGVSNTPGVLTEATADLAFALLLAVARRIPENDAELRRDTRVRWTLIPDTMGLDVSGRTLGILGMGGIGLAVARRALLGFGMPVLFSGGSGAAADEARALGAREVDRDALLRDADFVSLHTPLTEATRGLIDADALPQTKSLLAHRAAAVGIDLHETSFDQSPPPADIDVFGAFIQYPGASGRVWDPTEAIAAVQAAGGKVVVAADLLALTLLRSPGSLGADVAVGTTQRFGVPLGFGGPHAGYMAVRAGLERQLRAVVRWEWRDAGRPATYASTASPACRDRGSPNSSHPAPAAAAAITNGITYISSYIVSAELGDRSPSSALTMYELM